MSMYDRDWYREDYKRREEKYGSDFGAKTSGRAKTPLPSTTTPVKNAARNSFLSDETTIVPCYCPNCSKTLSVRIKKGRLRYYKFQCPQCKNNIVVQNASWGIGVPVIIGLSLFCNLMATLFFIAVFP